MLRSGGAEGRQSRLMPDTLSVKIVKNFTYRGAVQPFSNRYHFTGATPADTTAWTALFDAIIAQEKNLYIPPITIVQAVGYAPGSDLPASTKNYTTAGTSAVYGAATPGDCAALLRHSTSKRSTKNHVVYCYSFYHGCRTDGNSNNGDTLHGTYLSSLDSMGALLHNGITTGGVTRVRCTPDGFPVVGHLAEPYITHRDFPR